MTALKLYKTNNIMTLVEENGDWTYAGSAVIGSISSSSGRMVDGWTYFTAAKI